MERHAFAYEVKDGCFAPFRRLLGREWPAITGLLDEIGAGNCSLWQIDSLVFGYYETGQDSGSAAGAGQDRESRKDGIGCSKEYGGTAERLQALLAAFSECGTWISSPAEQMRLMYEDIGVVRHSKELIRHRVFATRLKDGMQEEYKRRHDGLAAARNGVPDPGPDSNFTIWNAGPYIFGYDEIDVTMEQEETEESRRQAIAWETRMLEIMRWYTDDVDWITGERHGHMQRIAWHA